MQQQLARLGIFDTVHSDWNSVIDDTINNFKKQQRPWAKVYADLEPHVATQFYLNNRGALGVAQIYSDTRPEFIELITADGSDWNRSIPHVVIRGKRLFLTEHSLERFESRFQRCFDLDRDAHELARYTLQVSATAPTMPDNRVWVPFHNGLALIEFALELDEPNWCWLHPHTGTWHYIEGEHGCNYTVITFIGPDQMNGNQFFDWWKNTEDQNRIRESYHAWCQKNNEVPELAV
jgi:hypothetical protein